MSEGIPKELLDKMEQMAKPSLFRTIWAFPITVLITVCIPIGFVLGAIYAGLLVGFSRFHGFAQRMAMEGMVKQMKRQGKG
jgi:hypothetical protein